MFWQNLKNQIVGFFRSRTWLSRIVIFDCVAWFLLVLADFVVNYFTLKGKTIATDWVMQWLCISDWPTFLAHPWTAITYFFVHTNFLSLLVNMLMLAVVGKVFYRYLSGRRFIATFLACGVAGVVPVLAMSEIVTTEAAFHGLAGSSAAVMGLFIALCTYLPDQNVFFFRNQGKGFKFKYIAYILVAFDLVSAISGTSYVHVANLGGELCGFLMFFLPRLTGGIKLKISEKSHQKRKGEPTHERPVSDEEYNRRRAENDRRIDDILDKISQSGYEKLTPEEKEFLFKSSNNKL